MEVKELIDELNVWKNPNAHLTIRINVNENTVEHVGISRVTSDSCNDVVLIPSETLYSEDCIQEENEERIGELESENDYLQSQVDELEEDNKKLSRDWIEDRIAECFEKSESISFEDREELAYKICEIFDVD